MIKLHYLFDPLSGACHGVAPMISAARDVAGVELVLHSAGLFAGENRRLITPDWRASVLAQDQRIARLSRQPFSAAYFDGLLGEEGVSLDSAPPTTAILAAEELAGRGLTFVLSLQQTCFAEGRHVWEPAVLRELAAALLFDPVTFDAAMTRLAGAPTERHFAETREWFARAAGKAYPTVVVERADGLLVPININVWLGRPADFAAALAHIAMTAPAG
jgi:putative protein-disulfide isomerase